MSPNATRRLVITAVLAGSSQCEVARTYGVSQGWISRLMKRYALEGEAALLAFAASMAAAASAFACAAAASRAAFAAFLEGGTPSGGGFCELAIWITAES